MKYLLHVLLTVSLILVSSSCKKNKFKCNDDLSFNQNLQILADQYISNGFPGIVLLVDHPENGYHVIESGLASTENNVPITKNHLFHSASLMKTFTATCILQLEETGSLQLSDLISNHLPPEMIQKIPNGDQATIHSLLNHTSGIPDFAVQSNYLDDLIAYTEGGPLPNDELEYIKSLNPNFPVGNKHEYCNTGYYILHHIVAQVSGISFDDYFLQNIIQKVGLEHTFHKNLPQQVDYSNVPDYYVDWENNGKLSNSSALENLATQTFDGYSGLLATIEDYHKFLKALFNGTIISNSSIEKMMDINHTNGFGYGQGLEVILSSEFPDKYGHKGGTQASFFYYPDEQAIVISMINITFVSGDSPFDKKGIASDEIGKDNNLIGEIELCLFE